MRSAAPPRARPPRIRRLVRNHPARRAKRRHCRGLGCAVYRCARGRPRYRRGGRCATSARRSRHMGDARGGCSCDRRRHRTSRHRAGSGRCECPRRAVGRCGRPGRECDGPAIRRLVSPRPPHASAPEARLFQAHRAFRLVPRSARVRKSSRGSPPPTARGHGTGGGGGLDSSRSHVHLGPDRFAVRGSRHYVIGPPDARSGTISSACRTPLRSKTI